MKTNRPIEVEKRFRLNQLQKSRALKGAKYKKEETHIDYYYDNKDFSFTKVGSRIRKRVDKNNPTKCIYELKIKVTNPDDPESSHFEEIEDKRKILKVLGLPEDADLEEVLAQSMNFIGSVETNRTTYKRSGFTLCYDKTDVGPDVFEIESPVKHKKDISKAEKRIVDFARRSGLPLTGLVPGKFVQMLQKVKPELYAEIYNEKGKLRSKEVIPDKVKEITKSVLKLR